MMPSNWKRPPDTRRGLTRQGQDGIMPERTESESRKLLRRLRDTLATPCKGQERLDRITHLIADSMRSQVCSIYLFRDADTLELCATEGLKAEAVHKTRLRMGEGLVGRVARSAQPVNTGNAPAERGFRFMPETGEEIYSSFLGVPIQRVGEKLGVLVVQSREARQFSEDEVYGLEVVAMVLAEMAELGAFLGDGEAMGRGHTNPVMIRASAGQEGAAEGRVWLHEPRVVVTNPVGDDPEKERARLHDAVDTLRDSVDQMLAHAHGGDKDHQQVLEAYRMFAHSRGWMRRMEEDIARGLSAEAAVEKEQSAARARLEQVPDPYLRDRLHDLDDLSNRLLRILTGQGQDTGAEMPENPVLVARNIGPAELLDYGRKLKGVVLEEGSVGSHAAIVARALAIPLVVHADRITTEALNGDPILVDGDQGIVHLRPDETVAGAFREKIAMQAEAQQRYSSLRNLPAEAKCGSRISLLMNAGLMADLPSLVNSGADGVGLFRTELQFLVRTRVPRRSELAAIYARVMDAAQGRPVIFRTLDIGSDKVLPYMKPQDEPNPAMGWRAIRVGLDKPGVLRMQLQALIRAAAGRPLSVMFPFIANAAEYTAARKALECALAHETALGRATPTAVEVGAMLETPSLAFAPNSFFEAADFISIGGNDLKQFFFAADRENERVRRRYDTLDVSYLALIEQIIDRCARAGTRLSFCGEDAGRPIDALTLAALGIRILSMRPASIGPVKHLIRRVNLKDLRAVIDAARGDGAQTVRPAVTAWLARQ
ncbi:phosphotransferase system enzyme I (PtsP) [Phaeovulum veldkampii DSM 11550]|nr:phosphotransferase system enzyme I (PtsP) [Phaeovulum veldkampii DSM 11550]